MEVTAVLFVSLWIAAIFTPGLGCPELCTCTKRSAQLYADCGYQDLTGLPDGLPSDVTTLSLSANKISLVPSVYFENINKVHTLIMAHNEIVIIEHGALSPLVQLRNLDISHNKIADFPWEDLLNLTSLERLKMNNNELHHLPKDAFTSLRGLRILRLNNNRFTTIAEGTFEGLVSLAHLQLSTNPFACTCSLDWLRDWISTTDIQVLEQDETRCSTPEKLKGVAIGWLTKSMCPKVTSRTEPDIRNTTFQEGTLLVLTCRFTGNPKPLVIRSIQSKSQRQQGAGEEDGAPEADSPDSLMSHNPVQVFSNWNLIISHFKEIDSGNFSCSATDDFGGAEDSVTVEVLVLPKTIP